MLGLHREWRMLDSCCSTTHHQEIIGLNCRTSLEGGDSYGPKTSPAPGVNASDAITSKSARSQPSRPLPRLGPVIARILGVVLVLLAGALAIAGLINFDSYVVVFAYFGVVAMLAALLIRSWWALLIGPLANTIVVPCIGLVWLLLEALGHGGPEFHDPGQLAGELLVTVLRYGVLPALVGALVGTLAWRWWVNWRHSQTIHPSLR